MKSLFVKLFIAFLLAMLISGAVFFSLAFWLHEQQLARHRAATGEVVRSEPPRMPPFWRFPPPPPGGPGSSALPPAGLPPPPKPPLHRALFFLVAIFLVVGGVICYLLAWRITAPVRRLRQVVQQLAEGDLTARSGIGIGLRGDEVADLGRDFDRMADRIEALLLSQKQLVRDISHELRSPLARLQVALGLARRHASPQSEQALNRIEREGERLNELIGELLTLSLLENCVAPADVEEFDLSAMLVEVSQDAVFEVSEGGRQVSLEVPAGLTMTGNRELLRRAVENVLRNAVRYTAEASAVELQAVMDGVDTALIRVRDRGPGVPDALLTAIFQPFCRVGEARDRLSGGAGIGLAITARAVALHGGTAVARNYPHGGLEVEIRLPLQEKR